MSVGTNDKAALPRCRCGKRDWRVIHYENTNRWQCECMSCAASYWGASRSGLVVAIKEDRHA